MAEAEGTNDNVIDMDQFLKQTKLGDEATTIIKQREVDIEELIDMNIDDLKLFATDLKLDTLAKNRFVSSINKLKKERQSISSPPSSLGPTTNYSPKQHVIVSPAEHNAIVKLYEKYDKSSALNNNIQNSIHSLNESQQFINNEITKQIDDIIYQINEKKQETLSSIDQMTKSKESILKQQLNQMENYLKIVNDGKNKYEQYMQQQSFDVIQRKRTILNMS